MAKRPVLTVDILIRLGDGWVFVKRKFDPYRGWWAIPGGQVEYGETVEQAAIREAREETGLDVRLVRLIGVYSDPARDPRGHYVSVAYLADAISGKLRPASDVAEVRTFKMAPTPLAFDHERIFRDGVRIYTS
jgi:8-oxo-dGTP diphosphatase